MRIFLMGGTGLVGSRLIERLRARKDEIVLLTRRPEVAKQKWGTACTIVTGDPMQPGPWQQEAAQCSAIINLVGENVFNRRWNAAFKQLMWDSRELSSRHAAQAFQKADGPRVLVNASAIGFYGFHEDEELTEDSPPGSDFMAQMCVAWEKAAQSAESANVRVVSVRVGVVLDKEGGALSKMMLPFKLFAGGPVGSGRQWVSWIHHEDMVGILLHALDQSQIRGPLNGTAPQPVTNKELGKALGRALHRPSFMPTPGFALRLALGEVADIVRQGQKVLPKKALATGYTFKYPQIDAALQQILS